MHNKNILRIATVTACFLLVPVFGNFYIDGWNWDFFDFVFAGVLIFGTGLLFELARQKAGGNSNYKLAAGVAIGTTFFLIWTNAAVGIIGNDNGSNLLYFFVLILGALRALMVHFESQAMARIMTTTAIILAFIPVIALFIWKGEMVDKPHGILGVFILNAIFVGLFIVSSFLFRRANTLETN